MAVGNRKKCGKLVEHDQKPDTDKPGKTYIYLTILDSYDAKTTENQTPLSHFG